MRFKRALSVTKTINYPRSDSFGSVFYRKKRTWEVQKKPYSSPLPFTFSEDNRTACYRSNGSYSPAESQWLCGTTDYSLIRNDVYSDLVDQLGDSATWANNLLEARGSLDMIVGRVTQVARFASALRKGDIRGAARALNVRPPNSQSRKQGLKPKDFGNAFLEWHFGWEPAIQDVGAAVNVLSSEDFGGKKLLSRKTRQYGYSNRISTDGKGSFELTEEHGTSSVKMGGIALVTNPNAFLANRMGFVNPLSVLWEAVPYSFVVDWFSNVGQVLNSSTDFVGVSLSKTYNTTFQRGSKYYKSYTAPINVNAQPQIQGYASTTVRCQRGIGIPGPVLKIKPFKGFSFTRGVTAVSLLLQKL